VCGCVWGEGEGGGFVSLGVNVIFHCDGSQLHGPGQQAASTARLHITLSNSVHKLTGPGQ
jgi:hypothetical protein